MATFKYFLKTPLVEITVYRLIEPMILKKSYKLVELWFCYEIVFLHNFLNRTITGYATTLKKAKDNSRSTFNKEIGSKELKLKFKEQFVKIPAADGLESTNEDILYTKSLEVRLEESLKKVRELHKTNMLVNKADPLEPTEFVYPPDNLIPVINELVLWLEER